jgi:hypothetical protein
VDVIVTVGGAVPATKQALQRSQVGLRADIAPSLRMSIFDPIRTDSAP